MAGSYLLESLRKSRKLDGPDAAGKKYHGKSRDCHNSRGKGLWNRILSHDSLGELRLGRSLLRSHLPKASNKNWTEAMYDMGCQVILQEFVSGLFEEVVKFKAIENDAMNKIDLTEAISKVNAVLQTLHHIFLYGPQANVA